MNKENTRFEINHLEFVGKQEDSGKRKDFFRAYGSEYEHIHENKSAKYIVTESIENRHSIVRFDSMILNNYTRLLPERNTYTRVDSHPQILETLYPGSSQKYDVQRQQTSKLLQKFAEEWEKKGKIPYEDKEFWDTFEDNQEYKEFKATITGIVNVSGGFLSYNPEKEILEVKGKSGNYGRPSEAHLLKLAPLILERYNQLAPVKVVSLDFGKNFLGRDLKNQMLEKMISGFNDQYIAVENLDNL